MLWRNKTEDINRDAFKFKSYNFCRLFCVYAKLTIWCLRGQWIYFSTTRKWIFFSQYLELEDKINKFLGNFWYCNSWHDELILGIFHSIALILKSTRQNLFDQFRLLFKKIFKKKINDDTCMFKVIADRRILRYVSRE